MLINRWPPYPLACAMGDPLRWDSILRPSRICTLCTITKELYKKQGDNALIGDAYDELGQLGIEGFQLKGAIITVDLVIRHALSDICH